MKIPRPPHNWSVTPREAVAIQNKLARSVRQKRPSLPLRYIAGVDAAFSPDNARCLAGVVLWDRSCGEVIEHRTASRPLTFPYIPGLLTFREAPAIIAALRKLDRPPDCLLCDGQGIAHPRRCGIASHLGLLVGLPAIGCAKTRLLGDYQMPGPSRGARSPLLDKGEVIGTVLRTRDRAKPVYVSVGHAIDLDTAAALALDWCRGYRLPEPARLAHQLAGRVLRQRQLRLPSP